MPGHFIDNVQTGSVFPRIVRAFFYVEESPPYLYVIETAGDELDPVKGKCEILRDEDGKPEYFLLDDARKFLKGEYDLEKKSRDTDIFNHLDELNLTERIYIVAPGENGRDYYDLVDPDCFTIIVNKACEIPLKRRDMWMVADPTPYHAKVRGYVDWFGPGLNECESIGCFNSQTMLEYFDKCRYTHEWAPEIGTEFLEPIKNRIRGGLTISGMALQMAYWLGAKEIVMVGVDISGDKYFDGEARGVTPKKDLAWVRILPLMNELIRWLESNGVKVYSLSNTALDVGRINPDGFPVTHPIVEDTTQPLASELLDVTKDALDVTPPPIVVTEPVTPVTEPEAPDGSP